MVVLLVAGTLVVPTGPFGPGRAAAASVANDVASVQNLYANDLLARVNAERAARTSPGQPIPPLVMDAGLNSAAQAWADHIASTGVVQDPPLAGCGSTPSSTQLCVMAGNAGDSGTGFWPGDGSDGMESEYMNSAGHRQNMLNAGYDTVGLGRDLQWRPGLDRRALRVRLRRPRPWPEPPGRPERRRGGPGSARTRRWPASTPA